MKKQVNEVSLERAKALLGNNNIETEKLKKLLEKVKVFCKVAYQLYLNNTQPDKPKAKMKRLDTEPPNEFTNAA
jgi:hypothetical protein